MPALTFEAWSISVQALLNATVEDVQQQQQPDGSTVRVTRYRHETDPPEPFLGKPKDKPGPLPKLVRLEEIAPKAKTETHTHVTATNVESDLDHALYHMARVVVVEARRLKAAGIGLMVPVAMGDGSYELGVVLVLS